MKFNLSNIICRFRIASRLLSLSEPEYQIDQPSDKGNQGNDAPKRFLPDGTEILSQNVDDCQYREQIKNDTYFNPYHYRCDVHIYPLTQIDRKQIGRKIISILLTFN